MNALARWLKNIGIAAVLLIAMCSFIMAFEIISVIAGATQ
jgi:hypothetical protein